MSKLWITADALARRLKEAVGGGIVQLAENECLTPSALDLADQRHVVVQRIKTPVVPNRPKDNQPAPPSEKQKAPNTKQSSGRSIGVVVDQPTAQIRGLVDAMYRQGLPLADYSLEANWVRNMRAMAAAVASGQLAGGVIIRPSAAEAMVLANKIRGIRAVQGTSRAAVQAACGQIGANVLVIESAASTFHEIRTMVAAFAAGRQGQGGQPGQPGLSEPSALLNVVDELERGG